MRTRFLAMLLGLYALIAVTPALIWLAAVLLDRVDDRLRDALGLTAYALPIALGLAAVTLALHGLKLNAAVQDDVEAELDELRDALAQPAMAGAPRVRGSGAGRDADVDAPAHGSKTSRTGPPKRSKGDRIKRRAKGVARAQLRRRTGF